MLPTEWVEKVANFLLWDVHDTFSLWFVPLRVSQYMRHMDLSFVLGSPVKASQLNEVIDVIDGIDWGEVRASQACRGSNLNELSRGRSANDGDYVRYDPFLGSLINDRTARSRTAVVQVHNPDLQHGLVFVGDASVAQRIANLSNTTILPAAADHVPVYNSMEDITTAVTAVDRVSIELVTVSEVLEIAGVPLEGVTTMEGSGEVSLYCILPLHWFECYC